MSASGVKNFIAAVDLVFPAPQYGGDKARQSGWLALMTNELGGYPDDVLAAVGKRIVTERKPDDGRFFPLPSEIIPLCDEIMQQRKGREMFQIGHDKAEHYDLARDLMKCPLGQQARKEGWDASMFYFCVKHGKAPSGKEIDECKANSKEFTATYEELLRGGHPLARPLAGLAEAIVTSARRDMDKPA